MSSFLHKNIAQTQPMALQNQCGFSLIEVMLALLIFAFVAGIGAYALRIGIDSHARIEVAEQHARQVDLMRTMIKRDLLQIASRPVRDEFGLAQPRIFYGGDSHPDGLEQDGEILLMSFVRHGWVNPDAIEPRSSLQYVQYVARDGALIRRVRPFLDDARGQERAERVLFENANFIGANFLRGERRGQLDWVAAWPTGGTQKIPRAVQLLLNDDRLGEVEYLFWVGEIKA